MDRGTDDVAFFGRFSSAIFHSCCNVGNKGQGRSLVIMAGAPVIVSKTLVFNPDWVVLGLRRRSVLSAKGPGRECRLSSPRDYAVFGSGHILMQLSVFFPTPITGQGLFAAGIC